MAECPKDYTSIRLPSQLGRIPIRHLSWKDIALLSDLSEGSHAEKRLMAELRKYLATIVTMQKQDSNWVYVVALNNEKWAGNLSYIEIVEKRRKYFHPRGINGWPKEPPNYIAFRYWGKLQQICHVEDAKVIDNFHPYFPESPNQKLDSPHWLYELGKPIFPQGVVRTGKIYASGRKWAMLDLLLTSRTIAAACKASKLREQKI
jgi:hypothetical protein